MTQNDNGPAPGRNYGETAVFKFSQKVFYPKKRLKFLQRLISIWEKTTRCSSSRNSLRGIRHPVQSNILHIAVLPPALIVLLFWARNLGFWPKNLIFAIRL